MIGLVAKRPDAHHQGNVAHLSYKVWDCFPVFSKREDLKSFSIGVYSLTWAKTECKIKASVFQL